MKQKKRDKSFNLSPLALINAYLDSRRILAGKLGKHLLQLLAQKFDSFLDAYSALVDLFSDFDFR